MKKIYPVVCVLAALVTVPAVAATAKKQSAIQNGTNIRAKVEAKGIYSQECYDAYYGCMDQFCITENSNGGSCACSDKGAKFESQLADILNTLDEANRIENEEVERINLGAKADIVFGDGKRKYDENGNVVYNNGKKSSSQKKALELFKKPVFNDDEDVLTETGDALFRAADELCREQIEEDCTKDFKFLKQIYARQIESDCKAFENSVAKQKKEADVKMASAESAVRNALKESFESANKYNQGECMVELRKCMQTPDACGEDWTNCVSFAAANNIVNKTTTIKSGDLFAITDSTSKILESKRNICERVLDQCMSVRDNVWTAFLREVAPSLRIAESKAESKQRQSCLTTISKCIQTACRDDIAGKGTATMDACLSRPEMAKSFCKVEIEPCEKVTPLIWDYVVDKLAAMRVDACTQEVKDCFTDENRCGPNFENCIGMDYAFIHEMCPLDKLVVCKQGNKDFSMDDVDSMLAGLYMNIDNTLMNNCLNLVRQKMVDVCGSEHDCNRFAADGNIGLGSLSSQKVGDIYRISGLISFGMIKMGDASGNVTDGSDDNAKILQPGEIGVADYIANVYANHPDTKDEGTVKRIEGELNNIAANINRTIELISKDPKIVQCVEGRDLSQVIGQKAIDKSGRKKNETEQRFPHLLDDVKMEIAIAGLTRARENYEAKYNEYVTKATRDLDVDVAQYMCQMMPVSGGLTPDAMKTSNQTLIPPYAISYDIGRGLDTSLLAMGGHGMSDVSKMVKTESGQDEKGVDKAGKFISTVAGFGWLTMMQDGGKVRRELPSGTREQWAVFNRETRTCHFCTSTVTKNCNTVYKKGFIGIGHKDETNCVESEPFEKCEDIQM